MIERERDRETDPDGYTEVFAWGADRYGQLGLGNKQGGRCYCIPRFCSFNVVIKAIACGEEHSAFITSKGHIFTMGSNNEGRLGLGDRSIRQSSTPCLVESLSKYRAIGISCGWGHSTTILETGELYAWGVGEYGALGIPESESQWFPTKVSFPEKGRVNVVQASCGTRHTAIVDDRGRLFMCGSGDAGQLGTGAREKEMLPFQINTIPERVDSAACGIFHTLVLTKTGKVYAMGGNNFGQLGLGNKRSTNVPIKVKELGLLNITKVAAGHHSSALTDQGVVYIWGTGVFGEFLTPNKLGAITSLVTEVEIGGCFGAAVDTAGVVYTWGSNSSGELGVGDYEPRTSPYPIVSLQGKPVTQISCGGSYALALGKTVKAKYPTRTPTKESPYRISYHRETSPLIAGKTPTTGLTHLEDPPSSLSRRAKSRSELGESGGLSRGEGFSPDPSRDIIRSASKRREMEIRLEESQRQRRELPEMLPERLEEEDKASLPRQAFLSPSASGVSGVPKDLRSSSAYRSKFEDALYQTLAGQRDELQTALSNEQIRRKKTERELEEIQVELNRVRSGKGGLTELNEMVNNKNDEIEKFRDGNMHNKDMIETLRKEMEDSKAHERKLILEMDDDKRQISKVEHENKILQECVRAYETDLDDYKREVNRVENERHSVLQQKTSDNTRMRDILKDYELKIEKEIEEKHGIMNEKTREMNKMHDLLGDVESKLTESVEEKDKIIKYYKREIGKYSMDIKDWERKVADEQEEKNKIANERRRGEDVQRDLENELRKVQREMEVERNDKIFIIRQLDMEKDKVVREGEEIQILSLKEGNLNNVIADLERQLLEQQKDMDKMEYEHRKLGDELRGDLQNRGYDIESLTKQINLKQCEIDTMQKDIQAWKEMVENLGLEKNQLLKMIEELEEKNRKLNDLLNQYMYNRAQEIKKKSYDALKASHSPARINRIMSSGHKRTSHPTTSTKRFDRMAYDKENSKSPDARMKEVKQMIDFEAKTVGNIKASLEDPRKREYLSPGPPGHMEDMNMDYLMDRSKYNIVEDPREARTNKELVDELHDYEDLTGVDTKLRVNLDDTGEQKESLSAALPHPHQSPLKFYLERSPDRSKSDNFLSVPQGRGEHQYDEGDEHGEHEHQEISFREKEREGGRFRTPSRGMTPDRRGRSVAGTGIDDTVGNVEDQIEKMADLLQFNSPIRKQAFKQQMSPDRPPPQPYLREEANMDMEDSPPPVPIHAASQAATDLQSNIVKAAKRHMVREAQDRRDQRQKLSQDIQDYEDELFRQQQHKHTPQQSSLSIF